MWYFSTFFTWQQTALVNNETKKQANFFDSLSNGRDTPILTLLENMLKAEHMYVKLLSVEGTAA